MRFLVVLSALALATPASAHHAHFRPSPELDAAAYLDGNAARFGLQVPASELEVQKIFAAPDGGHIVRFTQKAKGIRVWNGTLSVRMDADGKVIGVQNGIKHVGTLDAQPRLTPREATRRAAAHAPEGLVLRWGAGERGEARLVVIAGEHARLAYEVWLPPLLRTDNPYFIVDAKTGDVLAYFNRVFHDSGGTPDDAQIFAASTDVEPGTLTPVVLGFFPTERDPAGHLTGTRITGFNCCATSGCDGVSPPPTLSGTARLPGVPSAIPFEIAICDELPRATNIGERTNYGYAPVAEPLETDPVPSPADGDEFAEVSGYYHANLIYDFVLGLDPTLTYPETSTPLRVTANFLAPKLGLDSCDFDFSTGAKCHQLARVDNAMFAPAGAFEDFGVETDYERPFDSLILFQGTKADFAYDADVIYHEFGHGVVNATARLNGVVLDTWGVWSAPGALNEGYADWLASAKTDDPVIGNYVGPRIGQGARGEGELGLRDISIAAQKCPDVIIGEVHQDSLPWSGALWDIRTGLSETGAFTPHDLDKAVLAALKGLAPDSSFDDAASATLAEIEATAPTLKASAEAAFRARGALGCERAIPIEPGKTLDMILLQPKSADPSLGAYAPGPVQLKMHVPEGVTEATFAYTVKNPLAAVTGGLGGSSSTKPKVWIAWSKDEPVKFSYDAQSGTQLDAGEELAPTQTRLPYSLALTLEGKCGGQDVYVAFVNYVDAQLAAAEIKATFGEPDAAKVEACKPPPPPVDPGPDAGSGGDQPTPLRGCGCGAADPASALPLLGFVFALATRRRRA